MSEPLWRWDALIAACDGEADGRPDTPITGVSIDSRAIGPGDLFVALKDKRDGHEFVSAAFAAGATAALVEASYVRRSGDGPLLRVNDTLKGLERMGVAARARLSPEARVIAVTGSVGKTTTKEMLRACLSRLGPTHAADKSFNNHWGVPLTLARMPATTRYGVFEIGMNHAGEITPLTRMVCPNVAIITTVAPVHLEYFGSVEEIAAAKAEIFDGLRPSGAAVLNRDNEHFAFLREKATGTGARIFDFSAKEPAAVTLVSSREQGGLTSVRAHISSLAADVDYTLSLPGRHIVMNSLAVLATLIGAGADVAKALPALAELRPPQGRGERIPLNCAGGRALLIDESYNANPVSMRAAIAVLANVPREDFPRRIAVIGDMLELGPEAVGLHEDLAAPINEAHVDLVFAAGPLTKALFDALPESHRGAWGETPAEIESALLAALRPGDVVMVKGSNGARTWQLAAALKKHFATGCA